MTDVRLCVGCGEPIPGGSKRIKFCERQECLRERQRNYVSKWRKKTYIPSMRNILSRDDGQSYVQLLAKSKERNKRIIAKYGVKSHKNA